MWLITAPGLTPILTMETTGLTGAIFTSPAATTFMGAGLGVVDFTAAAAVTRAEVSTAEEAGILAEASTAADAADTVNGIFSRMDRR
jgi:hypothetical protein